MKIWRNRTKYFLVMFYNDFSVRKRLDNSHTKNLNNILHKFQEVHKIFQWKSLLGNLRNSFKRTFLYDNRQQFLYQMEFRNFRHNKNMDWNKLNFRINTSFGKFREFVQQIFSHWSSLFYKKKYVDSRE